MDLASLKMAYEAMRDAFFKFRATYLPTEAPQWYPESLGDAYVWGYDRGLLNALEFEPDVGHAPPPELSAPFDEAWSEGYMAAQVIGEGYRRGFLSKLIARADL